MKRMLTLPSWAIFLLTAGLPLLSIPIGVLLIVLELFFPNLSFLASSGVLAGITVATWIIGSIFMPLWVATAGIHLLCRQSSPTWIRRALIVTIVFASAVLLFLVGVSIYAALEPAIMINEPVTEDLDHHQPISQTLISLIVAGLWFGPRLLLYGIVAWLLVTVEGRKRWFSTFILFLLWPIGIWFLQPRIRKIFRAPEERDIADHLI